MGWEVAADGVLLARLHRGAARKHRRDGLMPHLNGHHTYVSAAPEHPCPGWDALIEAFHNNGMHPTDTWQTLQEKALSRNYRRYVRKCLLELQDCLCPR